MDGKSQRLYRQAMSPWGGASGGLHPWVTEADVGFRQPTGYNRPPAVPVAIKNPHARIG